MADVTKEIEKLREDMVALALDLSPIKQWVNRLDKDMEDMKKEIRSIYTMLERLFVEKEDK